MDHRVRSLSPTSQSQAFGSFTQLAFHNGGGPTSTANLGASLSNAHFSLLPAEDVI